MSKKIITINRMFGSGGRAIGKALAENLGISFYDKELIDIASKEKQILLRAYNSMKEVCLYYESI